jgi:cytidylate kinase
MPYKINKRASERARRDNMTIKNMVNKIINNALNSEQYFQLFLMDILNLKQIKLVIDK